MISELSLWTRLRDNNKRRYWIGILDFVLLFMFLPLRFLAYCAGNHHLLETGMKEAFLIDVRSMLCRHVLGPNEYMIAFLFLGALLSAIEGYSYLYQMRKVDMLHSQPVSCRRRFFCIYVNGAVYFLLPYLVNTLLTMMIALGYHVMSWELVSAFLFTIVINTIAFLAFYHTVILAVVLTGNYIACFCGTAALFGIEWAFRTLFYEYCTSYLKTFSYRAENQVMNPIISVLPLFLQGVREARYPQTVNEIVEFSAKTIWVACYKNILIMVLVGAITLGIAYLAYYHRPVEAAGKPLVLDVVKPIAKILAIILLSLVCGRLLSSISGNNLGLVITGLILGAIIAQCIMEIIYEARWSAVFGRLWQFLVGIAIVGVIFTFVKLDLFRYDQSVPKSESVDSFAVLFAPQELENYYVGNERAFRYVQKHMFIRDTDLLEKLAAADYYHQTGEKELVDDGSAYTSVDVIYRMNNGAIKYRTYFIDIPNQIQLMNEIFSKKEYQECIFPIITNDFMKQSESINILVTGITREYTSLSSDLYEDLKKAYKEDMKTYSYSMVSSSHQLGVITITDKNQDYQLDYSFPIYEDFVNVNDVLDRYNLPISEEVDVSRINRIELSYTPQESRGSIPNDYTTIIWEKNKIEKILDYAEECTYGTGWKSPELYYGEIFLYATLDSGNGIVYSFTKEKGIPDWIKKELQMVE